MRQERAREGSDQCDAQQECAGDDQAATQFRIDHCHGAAGDRKRKVKSGELVLASTLRMVDIISGRVVGAYGLGQKRSLEQFCEFSEIPYDKVYRE